MKKKVIAYLHTHWDREWYREFESFRLRLLYVFDNILNLLEQNKIPCFYFDGQTSAIEDYLELRPEKEALVKLLIKQKKLFIGPCYTLVDEFLTDDKCFRKNLELGIEYSKKLGCQDFIGYFADTFGHSQNIPSILKEFGIDKAIVWRGCPEEIPAEFLFNGVKTVNLIRGYFNDIFSNDITIQEKSDFLKKHLDKIAQKSGNVLLMPIGADHLDVDVDVVEQIKRVNNLLKDYEIELASPFKYFELVNTNFKYKWDKELRDNSQSFILPGCYSARTKLKQYNTMCSYKLDLANKFQAFGQKKYKTSNYDSVINHGYKLLLQNQAHDSICGCSIDDVHEENMIRYKKILQIADVVIREIKQETGEDSLIINLADRDFSGVVEFESDVKHSEDEFQILSSSLGFCDSIVYNSHKIPVTEDYKPLYNCLAEIVDKKPSKLLTKTTKAYGGIYFELDLKVSSKKLSNSKICLTIDDGQISVKDKISGKTYQKFIEIVDFKDNGDTYNFAPVKSDKGEVAKVLSSKVLRRGDLQCAIEVCFKIKDTVLKTEISLNKNSRLLKFKVIWENKDKNHLLQVKFNLPELISQTFSDDMGSLITREFNPNYNIRKNLPKTKGIEAKTNTAPMQRYVSCQDFEVITKGLTEYEVSKNSLLITLLRSIGIISNPKNPARTTPAGPPIPVLGAQQLGANIAEFAIGFNEEILNWEYSVDEVYPYIVYKK